ERHRLDAPASPPLGTPVHLIEERYGFVRADVERGGPCESERPRAGQPRLPGLASPRGAQDARVSATRCAELVRPELAPRPTPRGRPPAGRPPPACRHGDARAAHIV